MFNYSLQHTDELFVHTEHKIGLRTPVWVTEAQNRVKRRTCQVQRRTWLFRRHENLQQRRTCMYRGARLCTEAPRLFWWGARLSGRRREAPASVAIRRTPLRRGARLIGPDIRYRTQNLQKTANFSKFTHNSSKQHKNSFLTCIFTLETKQRVPNWIKSIYPINNSTFDLKFQTKQKKQKRRWGRTKATHSFLQPKLFSSCWFLLLDVQTKASFSFLPFLFFSSFPFLFPFFFFFSADASLFFFLILF